MSESVKLLPCPFCGSTNIDPEGWVAQNPDGSERRSGPACDDCVASAASVDLWNKRFPAAPTATAEAGSDTWRKPPPHFNPDARWQRQPQSNDEWDAHKDKIGKREFRAKRRLAFATDLADPRAPECMALVSRLDISVVLSRLSWLEARFENTAATALPATPSAPTSTRIALEICAKRFREYEQSHLAKGTPDGKEKSLRNKVMAEICETELALCQPTMAAGLTVEQIKACILTVPVRFVDNPDGGIMDELPVYIAENHAENFARAIVELLPTSRDARQAMVIDWVRRCFGEACATDGPERGARVLEEALELAQVAGLPLARAAHLTNHVYSKPVGAIAQEIGGVAITLLSFAAYAGLSADAEEIREFNRIMALPVDHFKRRHREKASEGITRAPEAE